MTDPFEVLRSPVVPTDPDPSFAASLRARLESALSLPRGVTVSDFDLDPEAPEPARSAPALRHGDVAYASLWVPDVDRASAFFSSVLDWRLAPGSAPQGRQVVGTRPGHGMWGGQERSNLLLCFAVDDLGVALERVRDAGGQPEQPRREAYGVIADCHDSQGSLFSLVESATTSSPKARPAAADGRPGDLAYLVLEVVDAAEARTFYGSVLGWQFTRGRVEDGWEAPEVVPRIGMAGGQDAATVVPMYRVDDIVAAVERVRTAGGTAGDPERHPYGITSNCVDDQGTRFYLGQL